MNKFFFIQLSLFLTLWSLTWATAPDTPTLTSITQANTLDGITYTTSSTPGFIFSLSDSDTEPLKYNIILDDNEDLASPIINYTSSAWLDAYSSQTATSGLIHHWRLDEIFSGQSPDIGSGSDNLSITGSTLTSGKYGQTAILDGVDDQLESVSTGTLDNLSAFSVAAWIYPTVTAGDNLDIFFQSNLARVYVQEDSSNSYLKFWTSNGGDAAYLHSLTYNAWNHLVAVADGTQQTLYLNGIEVTNKQGWSTDGATANYGSTASNLNFGDSSLAGYAKFSGNVDDIRVYNRALNLTEIQDLTNNVTLTGSGNDTFTVGSTTPESGYSVGSSSTTLSHGRIHYSIEAIDSSGSSTALSGNFVVDDFPDIATLTTPIGNPILNTPNPSFEFWASDPDNDDFYYDIFITSDSSGSAYDVSYTSTIINSTSMSFTLGQAAGSGNYGIGSAGQGLAAGNYFWDVIAYDEFGLSVRNHIGESGNVTTAQADSSEWHTVNLIKSYVNPIVIMSPLFSDGTDPATLRVRNVASNSFEFQVDEWDYQDGSRASSTIGYLVLESGAHRLPDGTIIQAGSIDVDENWSTISFPLTFSSTPVVVAQVSTYNSSEAAAMRPRNISTSSMQMHIESEKQNGQDHATETVHWVAIDDSAGQAYSVSFESDLPSSELDNNFSTYTWTNSISNPVLLAALQSEDGGDPSNLHMRNLLQNSVDLILMEEESDGSNMSHTNEPVGFMVFEKGILGASSYFNINDIPYVSGNTGLTLAEGASDIISSSNLLYSDKQQSSANLIYSISSVPTNGTLYLSAVAISSGDNFLQSEISSNNLSYTHDGGESSSDSITFTVSDNVGGITSTASFLFTITPVNDPPVQSTLTDYQLNEGATEIIASANLQSTDPDDTAANLTYTIGTVPANGNILLSGVALSAGGTFTQAQVDSSIVTYQHNSSETSSDSVVLTLSDAAGSSVGPATITFNINAVNDTPILNSNTGLTLLEGNTALFTSANLQTLDAEQAAASLTYTLTAITTNGTLSNGAALGLSDTFTQADIDGGSLSYLHDGSENASDSFAFTLSDGQGGSIAVTTVNLAITLTNDTPSLANNTALTVAEGGTGTITATQLQYTDPEQSDTLLSYTITSITSNGNIQRSGTLLSNGSTFTQDDINNSLITYSHNSSETISDSLELSLSDGNGGTVSPIAFTLSITPVNDAPTGQDFSITTAEDTDYAFSAAEFGFADDEGDSFTRVRLASLPSSGNVELSGTPLLVGQEALVTDINSGLFNFAPALNTNASPITSFQVTLSDGSDLSAAYTITVNATAVNDAPTLSALASPIFNAIDEDITSGSGNTIAEIIVDASMNDVDGAISEAIALTGIDNSNGTWQYSDDGGSTWTSILAASDAAALLLDATDRLRFIPTSNWNGTTTIQFRAWDQSSGSPGDTVAVTSGGSGAMSSTSDSALLVVNALNDAPELSPLTAAISYTENDPDTIIHSSLSVSDIDNTNLSSANIEFTINYASGQDILEMLPLGSITASFNSSTGILQLTGNDTLANYQNALRSVTYRNATDQPSTSTRRLEITVYDGSALSSAITLDITVIAVNDSPIPIDDSGVGFSTDENTAFVTGNVLSNDSDLENDILTVSAINTGSTIGTVTIGTAGILNYDPNGQFESLRDGDTSTDTFIYTAEDTTGATANAQVTITINGVNDGPTGFDDSYSLAEGATLSANIFEGILANDSDPENDALNATLVSGPSQGSLTLSLDGSFSYTHNGSENTNDSFTYTCNDGALTSSTTTVNLTVNPVNDPPLISGPGPLTTLEDTPLTFSAANIITVSDSDASGNSLELSLSISSGNLSLANLSGLSFSTGDGTLNSAMTFTGTITDLNNALDGLTFTPSADYNGTSTLILTLDDQGNSGSGIAGTDSLAISLTITPVNDAPGIDNSGSMRLADIDEDETNSSGNTISDILDSAGGDRVTDIDVGASEGVALVDTDLTLGQWQYSLNNGGSWTNTPSVSQTSALLLAADAKLRFIPSSGQNGSANITFHSWDRSDGYSSGTSGIDASSVGGTTAFSTGTETAIINILPVNDAPSITLPTAPTLAEETLTSIPGITLSDIDGDASADFDLTLSVSNATLDITTLTGLTFMTGDGSNDTTMSIRGTLTNLNNAMSSLALLGDTNYNGTVSLAVNINDLGSSGSGGAQQNSDTLLVLIDEVNDAPILHSVSNLIFPNINEDDTNPDGIAISTLLATTISNGGDAITDPDGVVPEGIVLTTTSGFSDGLFEYSLNGGGSYSTITTLSATDALLLPDTALLRFIPTSNFNGNVSFGFRAWDKNSGVAGGRADISTTGTGGSTAFSSQEDSVTLTVDTVNDAPALATPGEQNLSEDGSLSFSTSNTNTIQVSDIDFGSNASLELIISMSVSNGNISLASTSGLTFTSGDGSNDISMAFSGNTTDINSALDGLNYIPLPDYNGSDTLSLSSSDQGQIGGTSLSDTEIVTLSIGPINDNPIINDLDANSVAFAEGSTPISLDVGTAASISDIDSSDFAAGSLSVEIVSGATGFDRLELEDDSTYTFDAGSIRMDGSLIGQWYSPVSSQLKLEFTQSSVNAGVASAILGQVRYRNISDNPSVVNRVVRFIVEDGDGGTSSNADSTITLNPINDIPVISYLDGDSNTFIEDSTGIDLDSDTSVKVYDVDSADFNGGSLQVRWVSGSTSADNLFLATSGGISQNSGIVSYSGNALGSLSYSGLGLDVSFTTTEANPTAISALIKALRFTNSSDAPDLSNRVISYSLQDGDDGTSTTVSSNISITPVNDAPVLHLAATLTLNNIEEDNTENSGSTVSEVLASGGSDSLTDVDDGPLEGIAITGVTGINGMWQYKLGSGSWNDFVGERTGLARLLRSDDSLRFIPNQDYYGSDTGSILFLGWDQSSGNAGLLTSYSSTGNTSAFSTNVSLASISVTPVNDAPIVLSGTLYGIEDNSLNFSADYFQSKFSDIDGDSLQSIQVISTPAHGQLTYLGSSVDLNTDISVANISSMQFTPDTNWNGLDSFLWKASDGNLDAVSSTAVNLEFYGVNDPPSIDLDGDDSSGAAASHYLGALDLPLPQTNAVDSDATCADPDSLELFDLYIELELPQDDSANNEYLSASTSGTSISLSSSTGGNALTFTGPASIDDFNTVLRTLKYNNDNAYPLPGRRSIDIHCSDYDNLSKALSSSIATSTLRVRYQAPSGSSPDIWYRADVPNTLVAGALDTWLDASGNDRNATQGSPSWQPLYSPEGQDEVATISYSSSSSQHLSFNAEALSGANLTLLILASPESGGRVLSLSDGVTTQLAVDMDSNLSLSASGNTVSSTGNTSPQLLSISLDYGNMASLYRDGTLLNTTTVPDLSPSLTLGVLGDGRESDLFTGGISEVALFARTLHEAERRIYENAMAARGQVSLGSMDLYSKDDGLNSHRFDVAGIGLGNTGDSVNSSASDIMSVTASDTISADSYILYGHNDQGGGIPEWTDTYTKAGYRHLDRSWAFDISGSPGNMDINWPLDRTPSLPDFCGQRILLVDSDGDGDFSNANIVSLSLTDSLASVSNLSIPDGAIITLGVSMKEISLAQISASQLESSGAITLDINLFITSTETLSVDLIFSNTNALNDIDYFSDTESITFLPGETTHQVTIDIIDDLYPEGDEMFTLTLANPQGGLLAAQHIYTHTILNDDTEPVNAAALDIPIRVTWIKPPVTSELGEQAILSIVLTEAPTGIVRIPIATSVSGEGVTELTELIFTPDNWNIPQTVVITGANDFSTDTNRDYTLIFHPVISDDTRFSGLDMDDMFVTNVDEDSAGITVFPEEGLITDERGSQDFFSIKINSQPTTTVTLSLKSGDASEISIQPEELSFNSSNWNTWQRVTVTGVDDELKDGDVSSWVVIEPSRSLDLNYHLIDPQDVQVRNRDNDDIYSDGSSNSPPIDLVLSPDQTLGSAPLKVRFDYSASDPEEKALKSPSGINAYSLTFQTEQGFLDYHSQKSGYLEHVFQEAGTYVVRLQAWDVKGATASITRTITVNENA
ncbi:MAG: tandem-95 repeat protein, partial [Planctomycetes bacterium]|nr:tandem-95 repeat protein [Planctomycetota bacterium]